MPGMICSTHVRARGSWVGNLFVLHLVGIKTRQKQPARDRWHVKGYGRHCCCWLVQARAECRSAWEPRTDNCWSVAWAGSNSTGRKRPCEAGSVRRYVVPLAAVLSPVHALSLLSVSARFLWVCGAGKSFLWVCPNCIQFAGALFFGQMSNCENTKKVNGRFFIIGELHTITRAASDSGGRSRIGRRCVRRCVVRMLPPLVSGDVFGALSCRFVRGYIFVRGERGRERKRGESGLIT